MKINYKTTTKILLCMVIYDTTVSAWNMLVIHPRNKKRLAQLQKERDDAFTVAHLLAQKMDAEGVELDNFDVIVLETLFPHK